MTYFVPFEGSALSEAALRRARDLAAPTDNDLIAFLVVPRGNAQWARKRWLDAGEAYDG